MNRISIEEFINISYVKDAKGRILSFRSRYASCFIITLKGRLKFTFADRVLYVDRDQGIFIPEGTAYTNECLDSAESISVNFHIAASDTSPCALNGMDKKMALEFYTGMYERSRESTAGAQYYLLSKLYQLAYLLFPNASPQSTRETLTEKARSYMQREYMRPDLNVDEVASFCNVSAVYLRKIMKETDQKTPFQFLTGLRMKKAYEMLSEKRPVKEVALSVGYSDIYQFSRAYKRCFGYPPSSIDKKRE